MSVSNARAAAAIDNLARDVRYACRSFKATPLVAVTVVMTVGLGLGLLAVVFTILNSFIFRVDNVRNPHELFAVERPGSADAEPELFTVALHDALVRETGVFSDAVALTPDIDTWIEGRRMEGPLVTGNFFHVLGVSAARGRTLTPVDDRPGGPPVIVLSHRAWSRHFAADPGVLTRTVLLNGSPFQVVGVMPEDFRGLTVFPPDFWAPLSLVHHFRPAQEGGRDAARVDIVGRLKPGVSRGQALAELLVWDARRGAADGVQGRRANLLREPRQGNVPLSGDLMLQFIPLFFAFGLILMIGWANVANLLLARAVGRQREIGIRLAIGASRRRIIWQLLTESLLLALVSAALAFGISRLALTGVVYAVARSWDPGFGTIRLAVPPADWRVVLFLVASAMLSTLFFALAPAFRATRLELVRAMRGEVARDARPGKARSVLVALQVTGSVLLLICSAVFLRSSWAIAKLDPGIRTSDIVSVNVQNEERREAIIDIVKQEPSVTALAASWPGLLGGRRAFAEGGRGKSTVTYQFVSPEYFGVLGIDLVRGRGFAPSERSAAAAVVVVSESIARELWPGSDAVGQALRLESAPSAESGGKARSAPTRAAEPRPLAQTFNVVGIARDVQGFPMAGVNMAGAGVYVPISADAAATSLTLRVRGDSERTRHSLVDRLAAIDPNMSEVSALRTYTRGAAYLLAIPFWLTLALGALALLLTLSGLYGVLSYLVEQSTREIGVRMALGATDRTIGALVLAQSARPVAIGLILGTTLTAALGGALLATPAAEMIGSIVRLFDPVAYAASLLCVVVACAGAALIPALRAGRTDPVAALRQY